jgi:hypothetical protein
MNCHAPVSVFAPLSSSVRHEVSEVTAPSGVRALVAFFVFGACMSGLSLASLWIPGSVLEVIWRVNPTARAALGQMGSWALVLMSALCVAFAFAAIGLYRRKRWGRLLAIAILSINMVGDAAAAIVRSDPQTLIGLPIAGLLIAYLMRSNVRNWFLGHRLDV